MMLRTVWTRYEGTGDEQSLTFDLAGKSKGRTNDISAAVTGVGYISTPTCEAARSSDDGPMLTRLALGSDKHLPTWGRPSKVHWPDKR